MEIQKSVLGLIVSIAILLTSAQLVMAPPLTGDTDYDGLIDADEINIYGTDPYQWDTDGDNYMDGVEVEYGTDPLDSSPPVPACCGGGPHPE